MLVSNTFKCVCVCVCVQAINMIFFLSVPTRRSIDCRDGDIINQVSGEYIKSVYRERERKKYIFIKISSHRRAATLRNYKFVNGRVGRDSRRDCVRVLNVMIVIQRALVILMSRYTNKPRIFYTSIYEFFFYPSTNGRTRETRRTSAFSREKVARAAV